MDKNHMRAFAAGIITALAIALSLATIFAVTRPPAAPKANPSTSVAATIGAPLSNSCSSGKVTFTFDDGPSTYTPSVVAEMRALHVQGIFFVIGARANANPQMVRQEVADGFVVGDHTYNHRSFTGFGPKTAPLTSGQVAAELVDGSNAIVAAGAPKPTLYRAPYDDVSNADNAVAAGLGLHVVMGYGNHASNHIVDSNDWAGLSTATIVQRVTQGYQINGFHMPGIQGGSVVIFHDGQPTAPNMIAALPSIVAYMNSHHLCSTDVPPANSTGSVVSSEHPAPVHVQIAPLPHAIKGGLTSG